MTLNEELPPNIFICYEIYISRESHNYIYGRPCHRGMTFFAVFFKSHPIKIFHYGKNNLSMIQVIRFTVNRTATRNLYIKIY